MRTRMSISMHSVAPTNASPSLCGPSGFIRSVTVRFGTQRVDAPRQLHDLQRKLAGDFRHDSGNGDRNSRSSFLTSDMLSTAVSKSGRFLFVGLHRLVQCVEPRIQDADRTRS